MALVSVRNAKWALMAGHEVGHQWKWVGDPGAGSRGLGRATNPLHDLVPVYLSILGLSPTLDTSFCVTLVSPLWASVSLFININQE